MRTVSAITRTLNAAVVLLLTAGCSVAVPESRAPAVGALQLTEQQLTEQQLTEQQLTEGATTAPGAGVNTRPLNPRPLNPRPLNRAEQLLPKVNVQPWQSTLPVVVQSANKDMQCSIDVDGAACHLLNEVAPRPGDIKGQCTGLSQYYGGYAVVTLDGGAQYGLCGGGTSPMEAEKVAGPAFPGPWLQDGQTVRIGNMVCERSPGTMVCAHLRTGHGFMIATDGYELW